ncbi:hypothetical protein CIG19_18840 [Enterobacterales bacterium CwR94]|nr:hypothetical protein CIG19_18840 [Enterobacterales bacterium CwR94]
MGDKIESIKSHDKSEFALGNSAYSGKYAGLFLQTKNSKVKNDTALDVIDCDDEVIYGLYKIKLNTASLFCVFVFKGDLNDEAVMILKSNYKFVLEGLS